MSPIRTYRPQVVLARDGSSATRVRPVLRSRSLRIPYGVMPHGLNTDRVVVPSNTSRARPPSTVNWIRSALKSALDDVRGQRDLAEAGRHGHSLVVPVFQCPRVDLNS